MLTHARGPKTPPCTGTIHRPKSQAAHNPRPTAKPSLSTHSYALNTMTGISLEAGCRSRSPQHPGQTPRPNPPRTTPANPAPPLARPGKTQRGVLRVQNAPEPDSQSIKNTTHQAPNVKPRPTAVIRHSKPKPKPFRDTATRATRTPGGGRDRTDDLLLAKQALSQLSYAPMPGQTAPGRAKPSRSTPGAGGPGRTRTSDPTLIKRVL